MIPLLQASQYNVWIWLKWKPYSKTGACLFSGENSIKDTVIRYRYGSMNRLLQEEYDVEAICYRYDLCGNRLKKESLAEQEIYHNNKRDQLTEHTTSKDRMFFFYYLQGNLIEETGAGNRSIPIIECWYIKWCSYARLG